MERPSAEVAEFMAMTCCRDAAQAAAFLRMAPDVEAAVNLFFDTQAAQRDPSPVRPEPPEDGADFPMEEEALELTPEEQKYFKNKNRMAQLSMTFQKKPRPEKSLSGRPAAPKEPKTGESFNKALPKFPLRSLPQNCDESVRFFCFIDAKPALLVYLHKTHALESKFQFLEKEVFGVKEFKRLVEAKAAFVGILDSAQPVVALKEFGIDLKKSPALLVFRYNVFGELEKLGETNLAAPDVRRDPAGLIKQVSELIELAEKMVKTDAEFKSKAERKYSAIDKFKSTPQKTPAKVLNKEVDLENERKLRKEQEENYQKMVKQKQEADKKLELEKQQESHRQKLAQQKAEKQVSLNKKFAEEKVDSTHAIDLILRLPNGRKVSRQFDARETFQRVHDFVYSLEEKGFENPHSDFEIRSGFPPRALRLDEVIRHKFGDSHGEVVDVREIHPD